MIVTLTVVAYIIVVGMIVVTIFAAVYHRMIYPKILMPSYNESYKPRCSVIVPCKGVFKNLEENIRSFLNIQYENYKVIFVVENENDLSVPVIKKVINENERASLTVAGDTKKCSQKNYNIIAGVEKSDNPDVYVFADSDIKVHKFWLSELVKPLSKDNISVTTGFRWLFSHSGKVGEIVNAYQNTLLFSLFSFVSYFQNIMLWGGSLAIKRKVFEELGVKEFWAERVVDDNSLSSLIKKNSRKSVMVSPCVLPTDDALPSFLKSVMWFKRQVMFLKAYQKPMWVIAIFLAFICFFFQLLLPLSIIAGLFTSNSFSEAGIVPALIFNFGMLVVTILYPFLGRHPHFLRFLIFQPLSLLSTFFAVFSTIFTNTVNWSGFKYKVDFNGKVVSIKKQLYKKGD